MNFIPYGRQDIREEDIEEVVKALKSDFITQGPRIELFESVLGQYTGAQFASVSCNGTAALHLACLALGVGPGDWVWTSPVSFVASSNCALYCGAQVDFVDIDPKTFNMDMDALRIKLEQAKKKNRLPKVVIPVHLAGLSCDMKKAQQLSKEFGFKLIEDACHAIGGDYLGNKVGSCKYSDIAVTSFHPVKNLTTGEGGCCFTNSSELHQKICMYRSHGITRDCEQMTEPKHGPWYYQQLALGFNYRITDIQAALGLSQLKRLDENIAVRRQIAERYRKNFTDLPLRMQAETEGTQSAYHLFIIQVEPEKRKALFLHMREAEIGVNLHYIPIHTQPFYQNMDFANGAFANSEHYYQRAISLPMFPRLSNEEQQYVCDTLKKFLT